MTIQVYPKNDPPRESTFTPRESNEFIRYNGWNKPYHYFQITGWSVFLLFGFVNFILLIPNMSSIEISLPLLIFNLIIYLLHFCSHVIASTINPVDNNVLIKQSEQNQWKPKKFDRTKHQHVIENQFCYICESTVGLKSKHCSLCNKCVSNFDHHCKWLNNCIGGKNYK